MPLSPIDLSVVIPVHNAASSIGDVVAAFTDGGRVTTEVVLVDDQSTDGSDVVVDDLATRHEQVTAIHLDENLGAGRARNRGFERVRGRYTWFFDADDIPHLDAMHEILLRLDASGADVAFCTYSYRRGDDAPSTRMNSYDREAWAKVMPDGRRFHEARLTEVSRLLGFANYPWNKIIRTATYRGTGLRFGSGMVHNDILGHWHIMLMADQLLLVDERVCTHVVHPKGANLTNRASNQRLQLFDALDETYDLIQSRPDLRNRYSHHYWSFVLRTAKWAAARVPEVDREQFKVRLQDHLLRVDIADYARFRLLRDADLANDFQKALLQ